MKKRILAALLAASMALCAGCGSQTSDDGEEQTAAGTAVEVAEVTKGAMSTEYSVNGKVVADNEVQVFPMLAGQVLTLSVSEGDKVAKGQTLLNVDTSSVTSTMSSLRESYNATKTATEKAIENAQIGVEQAQLAVENTEALLEAGAAAEQDLTKAKQGLAQAQAGVQQARAQQAASLAQIQASMDQINKQASYGTVTAPCAGTVTAVNVVQGGMASSAQPAVVIAEDSRVKINASVSEDVFAGLHTGDSAGVQISVLSDEVKSAKIVSLPAAANQQTNLYDVSVSVPSGTEPAIGAFATVIFYTDRRENTLSVPTDCVLTGNDNERYLFTVDESGTTAARVTVETGLVGKTNTEITSGLNEGDRVVVKGQSYLSDGSAVRVVTSDGGEG
ncbi:efflux RND transporter periplasmic adaptor subunit [Agathobaculum butyriciproducens]|uniref:Efflux RND transporter periplasmic adaptor subunit n=1 Tax=Agathobaculum hominis TaxID=2763014 RepID=A0ABR7GN41_9FIRM|nr:efflux RND transporter periplasmic adaptor subunit [Agathobaculum hominis]MBC5695737.1 efflux RND transporter periplasmic adaptor subunit [Agathobaculum hominis]MCO7159517.1 efflux RND transporter periplasmic adaptor subunit [Agathobaculum butyriciproducens]MEE0389548.1 efflux RND transporter periplasmic adaptor subunit [Agathobaculum sp.]